MKPTPRTRFAAWDREKAKIKKDIEEFPNKKWLSQFPYFPELEEYWNYKKKLVSRALGDLTLTGSVAQENKRIELQIDKVDAAIRKFIRENDIPKDQRGEITAWFDVLPSGKKYFDKLRTFISPRRIEQEQRGREEEQMHKTLKGLTDINIPKKRYIDQDRVDRGLQELMDIKLPLGPKPKIDKPSIKRMSRRNPRVHNVGGTAERWEREQMEPLREKYRKERHMPGLEPATPHATPARQQRRQQPASEPRGYRHQQAVFPPTGSPVKTEAGGGRLWGQQRAIVPPQPESKGNVESD